MTDETFEIGVEVVKVDLPLVNAFMDYVGIA